MDGNEYQYCSLQAIIGKIGHPLEEIRLRSLNNIFQKLEYGLIQELDLIKENRLLVGLFEWFNFPDSPKQAEVLKLILQLSKHPKACQHFVSIGAVKFLSDLRENQSEELHEIIDAILEKLFLLPDVHVNKDDEDDHDPPPVDLDCSTDANNEEQIQSEKCSHINSEDSFYQPDAVGTRETDNITLNLNPDHEFSGFTLLSLKWISVSATDLNILSSTNKSLESDNSKSVSNSCNFLNDVVFRDFPPEIFLQHSQIVKSLFRLLTYSSKTSNCIPLKAIGCLLNLTKALLVQINNCQDAAIFNFKQSSNSPITVTPDEFSDQSVESQEFRPSVIGHSNPRTRGDGQDGDISPQSVAVRDDQHVPSLNNSDAPFLPDDHSQEISIPQFCLQVFSCGASLLRGSNPQVLMSVLELLLLNCDLLSQCINAQIWKDRSNLARELIDNLLMCYDILASAILVHHKESASDPHLSTKVHRLAVLGIASLWARLMQTNVILQENVNINLPGSCLLAFSHLSLDFLFAKTQPDLHTFFTNCISIFNPTNYDVYQVAYKLSQSMNVAVQCAHMAKESEMFWHSEAALSCLHYFHYWQYIDAFVDCLSKVCANDASTNSLVNLGYETFLKLLAYPEVSARSRVIFKCLSIVKDCLGLCQVTNISLSSSCNIRFLLKTVVLKQIIFYGLQDVDSEISSMIREILLFLARSKMLMLPEIWDEFLNSFLPVLPILQAYTDTSTSLGLSLFHLINTDNTHWPKITLLRANVRLLFSKDQRLRLQVIPRIAWFLAQENGSLYKHPSLLEIDACPLSDIFIKEFLPLQSNIQPSHVLLQTVDQLFHLFASNDGELYTRRSAGQQLAFLVNDSELVGQLRQLITYDQLFDILQSCLITELPAARQQPHTVDLIPVTIEIIWKCLMKDHALIWCVADNENVYYSLLRAALIFKSDDQICGHIRLIMAALLFYDCCDIHKKNESPMIFGASAAIHDRFVLPFADVQCQSSGDLMKLLPVKFDDQCIDQLFHTYLRFSWNVTLSGGWDDFVVLESFSSSDKFSFNDAEKRLIKVTQEILVPELAFMEIIKASSHKPVLLSLKLTSLQLIAVPLKSNKCAKSVKTEILQTTFLRFLSAPPKSNADKTLVRNILQFLNLVMHWHLSLDDSVIEWFYSIVSLKDGAISKFLQKPSELFDGDINENNPSHYSPLIKELLEFLITLLSKTPYSETYTQSGPIKAALASMIQFILRHMNLAEAPQFYNLASLEAVLQCLVHITSRPGFSRGPSDESGAYVCRQLTALLMEVIAAFHLTRDGTNHSFMGRGVTMSATICLNHVAAEMQSVSQEEAWFKDWLYNHQPNESSPQLGLEWLIPLWTHKDPEVRVASLSIIVCLTNSKAGCKFVLSQIQQIARGVVGVALSFLLESDEASLVQEQAALLLVNLTSHLIPCEANFPVDDDLWQELIVAENEMQVPLSGVAALIALLHRSSFMKGMAILFENFFVYPKLVSYVRSRHVQCRDFSNVTSCNTLTSFDFGSMMTSENPATITSTHFVPGGGELELPGSSNGHLDLLARADRGPNANSRANGFACAALSTPALVSSVCLLLRNLVHLASPDILISLKQEAVFEHLVRILDETKCMLTKKNVTDNHLPIILLDVLDMMSNIMDLLAICCRTDPHIGIHFAQHKTVLSMLISCLDVSFPGPAQKLQKLWTCTYSILTAILAGFVENELDRLAFSILEQKDVLFGNVLAALEPASPPSVKQAALLWLTQTLSTFYSLQMKSGNGKLDYKCNTSCDELLAFFDAKDCSSNDNAYNKEIGAHLAMRLLILQKFISHNPESAEGLEEMHLILKAFSILLAFSLSAKMVALEGNLIAIILERLKRTYVHISLVPTDANKPVGDSRENVMLILIGHFNLLKNLMHKYNEAKHVANDSGFPLVVSQFWTMALSERTVLFPTFLSSLCTYVAQYPAAGKSLATTSIPSANQKGGTGATLLHEVLKICRQMLISGRRPANNDVGILELCFTLLASVSSVPLCRSIIAKSKLLCCFPTDQLKKAHLPSLKDVIGPLWFKLLINFSFISEGQDAILGIPDIIDILSDFVNKGSVQEQEASLLILRNLCFSSSGKTKLLSSDEMVATLTSHALNDNERNQVLAASAIWALLANSQKVKAVIKSDYFLHRVQDTLEQLAAKGNLSFNEKRASEILETIRLLLETD